MNVDQFILEEEVWIDQGTNNMDVKSHNVTWSKYADMYEESRFVQASDNPNWTQFEQTGHIQIKNLGLFNKVLEAFAGHFLHAGSKKVCFI